MIAVDTNVLVRFLTQDDPGQCKIVNQMINEAERSGQSIYICKIILCELIWVLERCYNQTQNQIIEILLNLLSTPQFHIEDRRTVEEALEDFQEAKSLGFPDCLIGRNNQFHGCTTTYTFDRGAAKHIYSFTLL